MDKSWIDSSDTLSAEYIFGVTNFLDFAFTGKLATTRIYCPCKKCRNRFMKRREDVKEHCLLYDFDNKYKNWRYHGEAYASFVKDHSNDYMISDDGVDIAGMVHEAANIQNENIGPDFGSTSSNELNEEMRNFFKLLQDAETELFPMCSKQINLSFVVRLLQLKILCGWTNKFVDLLLELLRGSFPDGANLPANYYEAQKITNE